MSFFKFPVTPYIVEDPQQHTRAEKILSNAQIDQLFSRPITVEEKIDGANLGISFDINGEIVLQNRGELLWMPYVGQWKKLGSWLSVHIDTLFDVLGERYILFGEWCYAKHSIYYSRLPDWFIAFDIYDKNVKRFLSCEKRNILVTKLNLAVVPQLYHGPCARSKLHSLLSYSRFGDEMAEGLYLRQDEGDFLVLRAKYVRSSFSQSIEEHWRTQPFMPNQLSFV